MHVQPLSATTRTSSSPASTATPAGRAGPREAQSLAQMLSASRGVMSTHQRPRSGTSMQRRRRAVRTVREKLAQVRSHGRHGKRSIVRNEDRPSDAGWPPGLRAAWGACSGRPWKSACSTLHWGHDFEVARRVAVAQRLHVQCTCCRLAPRGLIGVPVSGGMFNGAEPIVEDPVSRGTAWS